MKEITLHFITFYFKCMKADLKRRRRRQVRDHPTLTTDTAA